MSESLGILIAKLQADVSDLKRGIQAGRQELNDFKRLAQNVGQQVKSALTFAGVTVGIAALGAAIKSFATSAAMTGARTETLEVAMQTVGKTAGLSARSLQLLTEDLKKAGITTQEAMSAITRSMAAGLDLSKLQELATRARDVAVVASENTSETMNKLIHGIISGQTEMFRNLGIPIASLEDVWKRYAAAIGKTKDELTQVEKANATLIELLKVTDKFAGAAAAADSTVNKMLGSLARFAEEAKNAIYPVFGPTMRAVIEFLTQAWKDLEQWAKENQLALQEWGEQVANWVSVVLRAIRNTVTWAVENRTLLQTLVELFAITKLTGYVIALGQAILSLGAALRGVASLFAASSVAALGAAGAFGAAAAKIAMAVAAIGAYGAYKQFTRPGGQGEMPAAAMGAPEAWWSAGPTKPESQPMPAPRYGTEAEGHESDPELARERLKQEMQAALDKAMREAPKPAGKAGGKGGAAKIEDFTRLTEKELKAQLKLEEEKLDQSLKLLEKHHDVKRSLLKQDYEAGKLDGAAYYDALIAMEQEHHQRSLALIDQKITAEKKLHPLQIAAIEASEKLSPEAKALEIAAMNLEYEARLTKLQGERQAAGLEHEKKLADLLREQIDWRERIADIMAQAAEENALGPIAEKEAEINRYLRERLKLRRDIPAELRDEFDRTTEIGIWRKTVGEEIEGWASTIASGFRNLFDALSDGTADLMQAMNGFFKSLFSESLEKGFKQLVQWITNALSQMFSSIGVGLSGAILGVIGLVGMLLTGGSSKTSWSPSGATTGITTSQALRGVIAGEATIPIAQISESIKEAFLPSERYLAAIAKNTGTMVSLLGGSGELNLSSLSTLINRTLDDYFRQKLVMGV